MAIALVAETQVNGPSGGGTSSAIDTTGATLLLITTAKFAATAATPTDSAGNTWIPLAAPSNSSGFTNTCQMFYAENPTTSATHTVTYAATNLFPAFGFSAWAGTATSSVFDTEASNDSGDASTPTVAPGSVTPDANDALVVTALSYEDAIAVTVDGGFTELYDFPLVGGLNFGGAAAFLIQTTAAAANPTWTFNASCSNASSIAVFRVAGGAPDDGTWLPQTVVAGGAVKNRVVQV